MSEQENRKSFCFSKLAVSWSPVVCFIAVCFGSFLHAHKKKAVSFNELKTRHELLINAKQDALTVRNDLQLQIESQSDPLWIEQTLMRGLGLVPDGQKKILFREK